VFLAAIWAFCGQGTLEPVDRITEVMNAEVALPDLSPAYLNHPLALVKPCHLRPAANQFGGIQPEPARGVQHSLVLHVA
jgi:hypothetical protein